ncbi:major facilitator superfamily domain-containing protein [Sporodiniella umbellata]|nr:major facilitator superfamily domain-containing protein [Sporodiniella umbellata]
MFHKGKPFFARARSSKHYVMVTVGVSALIDTLTYNIIVPIIPFAINAINQGESPDNLNKAYGISIDNKQSISEKSGIVLSLFYIGSIAGSLSFGYLGLLLSCIMFMLGEKYWELLLARFLQGFSSSSVWTLGMCLASDTFALEELGTQMGRITMFHTVGLVSGAPIGGKQNINSLAENILSRHIYLLGALYHTRGYKAPFIFCIAIAGLDFLLRLFLVERKNNPPEWFEKDSKNQESIVSQDSASQKSGETKLKDSANSLEKAPESLAKNDSTEDVTIFTETVSKNDEKTTKNVTYWSLLKEHRLLAGMIVVFYETFLEGALEATLSLRLSSEWGYDSSKVGLVFFAYLVPYFIGLPLSGIIADQYGPKILIYPTWIICAIAIALSGIPNQKTAGGIAPLIFLLSVEGSCVSCFYTPVLTEVAHISDKKKLEGKDNAQNKGYALISTAFSCGGAVGPVLAGYLYHKIGFSYVCLESRAFI